MNRGQIVESIKDLTRMEDVSEDLRRLQEKLAVRRAAKIQQIDELLKSATVSEISWLFLTNQLKVEEKRAFKGALSGLLRGTEFQKIKSLVREAYERRLPHG